MNRDKIGNLLLKFSRKIKIPKSEYHSYGETPIIDQSKDGCIAGYTDNVEARHEFPLPITVFVDHTRVVKYANFPFASGADGTQLLYPRDESVDPTFFYYAIRNVDLSNYFYARHFKFLKEQEINLPRYEQQCRIAETLRAYDDLIENNRRRMYLLEETARQIYHEWFVRLRFPGYQHARIANGVPEGWERVPVPAAMEVNPSTKLSDETEHWYVEMADLPTDSMVIQNAVKRVGRSGSKFKNGDTLFARITPCLENGKTGFVDFMANGEVGRGSTEFIVLRALSVNPEYVYCLARTYEFRENAITSMVGSSGRQRVHVSCFDKFLIWLPPKSTLCQFRDIAHPLFEQIKTLHTQTQKLAVARDLLLPKLMNGEISI